VPAPDCRLGIDVGGTNTDAVIMDAADRVVAKAKVPCTPDITGGIMAAIDTVLQAPGVEPHRITHVMLGTTHATNAVLERKKLRRVAVVRLGGPATHAIRPMFEWPKDLAAAVSVGAEIVDGGIEFDGRDLSPLDTDALARFLGRVGGSAQGVVITSVFAPVSARQELQAAEIVKRELGDVHISLSHEIGSLGLLERENATILNGALAGVANDVADAMRHALAAHHLQPATFFAQNDGTLMGLDHVLRYPVLTIGSGPANSVRGAAFLTSTADSLVVDVGGTSTDVGVLVNGFPRESSQGVEIGGVRTNFRMPDLVTIAPTSTPSEDSRGNPLTSTPTSVEVPPTSTTSESELPVRNAAPRTLLAGPEPIVRTGCRSAWSSAISVPSFCAKNVVGSSWCVVSALRTASATSLATPTRAPLRMVAFSRSSRPIEPISWLSEMCTSPSSRLTTSAASSSCRGETGANTLVIATPSAAPPTSPRNRAIASVSSGDRSRPSNSMPPSTMAAPTETASARSRGHPNIGRTLWVAGPPSLIAATRRR
jgi:hypothetical protein